MRGGVEAVGCSGTRRKCVPSSAGRGSAGCCRGGVLESVRNGCTKIPALGTFCRVGSYMRTYVRTQVPRLESALLLGSYGFGSGVLGVFPGADRVAGTSRGKPALFAEPGIHGVLGSEAGCWMQT